MLNLIQGISVSCFVSSYVVALLLELSRFWGKVPRRTLLTIGFIVAGLLAQGLYLFALGQEYTAGVENGLFAGWYDWSLLVAWAMAACYLVLFLRRPDTTVGIFLLPSVLALIALARLTRDWLPFSASRSDRVLAHDSCAGDDSRCRCSANGFHRGADVPDEIVSSEIKTDRTIELQAAQLGTVAVDESQLLGGQHDRGRCRLVSGVIMNLNRWGYVAWGEGGVVLSSILFVWLVLATAFEFLYQPARQGRKVVYLTLASFGFFSAHHDRCVFWRPRRKEFGQHLDAPKPHSCFRPSRIVSVVTPTTHVGAWNREAADDRLQPSKRSRRVSRAVRSLRNKQSRLLASFDRGFPQPRLSC